MKKRILLPVMVVLFCMMNVLIAAAVDVAPPSPVMDEADILSAEEEDALITEFENASKNMAIDILAATVNNTGSEEAAAVAEQKYKEYMSAKYGKEKKDGILLLLSMEDGSYALYGEGRCQNAVTQDGMTMIESMAFPSIADGRYLEGLTKYGQSVIVLVAQAETGEAFKAPFNVGSHLLIGLVVGLIIALIVTGSMKGQLNSVHKQYAAASYIKKNSLHVTAKQETYLYKKLEKTEKANTNTNASANNTITANAGGKSASGKF